MITQGRMDLDRNGNPIYAPLPFLAKKRITFAGGTANAVGDYDGTGNPAPLFNVTDGVLAILVGVCRENLAGANATLEAGVEGFINSLLAQKTATDVDANKVFVNNDLNFAGDIANARAIARNIILTVATANITGGIVDFYCFWRPLGETGLVVPA